MAHPLPRLIVHVFPDVYGYRVNLRLGITMLDVGSFVAPVVGNN